MGARWPVDGLLRATELSESGGADSGFRSEMQAQVAQCRIRACREQLGHRSSNALACVACHGTTAGRMDSGRASVESSHELSTLHLLGSDEVRLGRK